MSSMLRRMIIDTLEERLADPALSDADFEKLLEKRADLIQDETGDCGAGLDNDIDDGVYAG